LDSIFGFLNKNSNIAKNLDVIENNGVHFLIQQPRNIPNQFTDLKQLKKSFFCIPVLFLEQITATCHN